MRADPVRLVGAARSIEDVLERDRIVKDHEAALGELVDAGVRLSGALADVVDDVELWRGLEASVWRPGALSREQETILQTAASGELAGILEVLGYQPPPPVRELVDETVDALSRTVEWSTGSSSDDLRDSRLALMRFQARLNELINEVSPEPVRRGRLRAMLRRGAAIVLVVAPIAGRVGGGYGGAALGVPQEVGQEMAGFAASALALKLHGLLEPELEEEAIEARELVSLHAPGVPLRAFAALVEGRLTTGDPASGLSYDERVRLDLDLSRLRQSLLMFRRSEAYSDTAALLSDFQAAEGTKRDLLLRWLPLVKRIEGLTAAAESQPSTYRKPDAGAIAKHPDRRLSGKADLIGTKPEEAEHEHQRDEGLGGQRQQEQEQTRKLGG